MECDGNDMKSDISKTPRLRAFAAGCVLALSFIACAAEPVVIEMDLPGPGAVEQAAGYIVQAASVEAAAEAVAAVGGEVTHKIGTIQAVGATLLPVQVELLKRRSDVRRVLEDTTVTIGVLSFAFPGANPERYSSACSATA